MSGARGSNPSGRWWRERQWVGGGGLGSWVGGGGWGVGGGVGEGGGLASLAELASLRSPSYPVESRRAHTKLGRSVLVSHIEKWEQHRRCARRQVVAAYPMHGKGVFPIDVVVV